MLKTVLGYTLKKDARGAKQFRSERPYSAIDTHHRGNKEDVSVCLNCSRTDCNGKCRDVRHK